MMTTDYEYMVNNQDQAQAERMAETYNNGTGKMVVEKVQNHHLAKCAKHIEGYEDRITNTRYNEWATQQIWEDREYKRAMMHAAYAQAEAQTRQAEALESLLEFCGDLIGRTDLVDTLIQWGYRQRTG